MPTRTPGTRHNPPVRRYGLATAFIDFGAAACSDLPRVESREWLVTNGIGGYACGTAAGTLTRRWHGLLVAATDPPAGRTLLLSKLDALVTYRGERYDLGNNRWRGGSVTAPGLRWLVRFHLEDLVPTWTWCLKDAMLEARVFMLQGRNATVVHWRYAVGSSDLRLQLGALVAHRPHNLLTPRGAAAPMVEKIARGVRVSWPPYDRHPEGSELFLQADGAVPSPGTQWWNDFELPVEASLGYDSLDQHFHAATFDLVMKPGEERVFLASTDAATAEPLPPPAALLEAERRRADLLADGAACHDAPPALRQLALAASQFIVDRPLPGGGRGHSIIAGYPWFADWSRDALISLPGLLLVTGRREVAEDVLRTLAAFERDGLLPNRFPSPGEPALDNAADAPLLFILAVERTFHAGADVTFVKEMLPPMRRIAEAYARGTRHGIGVDPADGLLRAASPGEQLTWMDARVGDRVVTPRMGKPVELNAMWHAALLGLAEMEEAAGGDGAAWKAAAARAATSFGRFWSPSLDCCVDVLDGPGGAEAVVRPNQLFAVSLGRDLLPPVQALRTVERCLLDLWMPLGVRTLAPGSPGYRGIYAGPVHERDEAYHMGVAWPWLFQPLMAAHLRVHHDPAAVADFMHPFVNHLREACVGQVSEVFDGDPPHRPGGCFAQAWSVASLLELWGRCRQATEQAPPGAPPQTPSAAAATRT